MCFSLTASILTPTPAPTTISENSQPNGVKLDVDGLPHHPSLHYYFHPSVVEFDVVVD